MSADMGTCAICSRNVRGEHSEERHRWLREFRGLYHGPEGLVLTGVGLYDNERDGEYAAPADTNARWDDPDENRRVLGPVFGVMSQGSVDGRHGYLFHESCWALLELAYHFEQIPFSRVYKVCRSIPVMRTYGRCSRYLLNWSHDACGMTRAWEFHEYPWEELDANADNENEMESEDPFLERDNATEILTSYGAAEQPPEPTVDRAQDTDVHDGIILHRSSRERCGDDPFLGLPRELLVIIATQLRTPDALNTRLASRAFGFIFHFQSFWMSRFRNGHERAWMFNFLVPSQITDWRALHRTTSDRRLSPQLQNRKRIHGHMYLLVDLLRQREVTPRRDLILSKDEQDRLVWRDLFADVRPSRSGMHTFASQEQFSVGCQSFYEMAVTFPGEPLFFTFHFITVGLFQYLCGIGIDFDTQDEFFIGYKSSTPEYHYMPPTSGFRGFGLAMGPRGIQAVQIHPVLGNISDWYGDARTMCPQTLRLVGNGPVSALRVSYDGCKFVGIGTSQVPEVPVEPRSLHQDALWYPNIPDKEYDVNSHLFIHYPVLMMDYQPLFISLFGGSDALNLLHLTKIRTLMAEYICRIEFSYDMDIASSPLGRHASRNSSLRCQEFNINGPGGEIVHAIKVTYVPYEDRADVPPLYQCAVVAGIEFFTNRASHRILLNSQRNLPIFNTVLLQPKPGHLITGLYASQLRFLGLTSMGIITERLIGIPTGATGYAT